MSQDILSESVKITRIKAASSAGATPVLSDPVNMDGFDGCLFLTTFGAITAGAATSLKVQAAVATGFGTPIDLAGTGITVADDDDGQSFVIDVTRPPERYLRLVVGRATENAVVGEIYAIQYRSRALPLSSAAADVLTVKAVADPVAGTP